MRREDNGTGALAQYILMRGERVYAVGVQHERHAAAADKRCAELRQLLRPAEAGSQEHGVHRLHARAGRLERGKAEPSFPVARERKDDLAARRGGHDRIDLLRHAEVHESGAGTQRGLCRKPCRTRQSLRAAEQQHLSVIALVRVALADGKQLPHKASVRLLRDPCGLCHASRLPFFRYYMPFGPDSQIFLLRN